MLDMLESWKRVMASGASMRHTGVQALETMEAAGEVIAARTPIIGMAMVFPMGGNHVELGMMIPEKVEAFSQAGLAAMSAWEDAQRAWLKHLGHLGGVALSGRDQAPLAVTELGGTILAITTEAFEAVARLGADMLARCIVEQHPMHVDCQRIEIRAAACIGKRVADRIG